MFIFSNLSENCIYRQ